jgi:hypothetical protein
MIAADLDFRDYVYARLGTRSWAVFHNRNHKHTADYEHPLTLSQFEQLKDDYVSDGGDPANICRKPNIGCRK